MIRSENIRYRSTVNKEKEDILVEDLRKRYEEFYEISNTRLNAHTLKQIARESFDLEFDVKKLERSLVARLEAKEKIDGLIKTWRTVSGWA